MASLTGEESLRDSLVLLLREYAEAFIITVLLALFLRSYVLSAYKIPTTAMSPTLESGDFVLGYRVSFGAPIPWTSKGLPGRTPRRGELVIFKCPNRPENFCVKRAVGLPGDRIEIKGKRLFINGESSQYARLEEAPRESGVLLQESWRGLSHQILISDAREQENFGPVVVPPDHFFVLGDNRDASDDSRFWGSVPFKDLEATVVLIWLSLDKAREWPGVRWERMGLNPNAQ